MTLNQRVRVLGWSAVAISAALTCLWTFWGIIENFHEGWYHQSLIDNVAMMMGQYLAVPLVFLVMALVAIRWPRLVRPSRTQASCLVRTHRARATDPRHLGRPACMDRGAPDRRR